MNALFGCITGVETDGAISIAKIAAGGLTLSALLVETPESCDYLTIGREVEALFKETEASIAKNLIGDISLRNRHSATIKSLRYGGLLCEIALQSGDNEIRSIITAQSAKRLKLALGDEVEWLVKANEISIRALDERSV
ncbi:MAG: TOBE domain-containing protein [Helicobacteraceae bacterium]|jgi:molybdate transport system regulatory protein|nr:TOBE domain-containing protein [Helicobacteraceae bacterium]